MGPRMPLLVLVGSTCMCSDCREGGGEMLKGLVYCGSRVHDGDGDKLHSSPIFLEGRDEGGLFFGLFGEFVDAFEVSAQSYFHVNKDAYFFVDDRPVRARSGEHASSVN